MARPRLPTRSPVERSRRWCKVSLCNSAHIEPPQLFLPFAFVAPFLQSTLLLWGCPGVSPWLGRQRDLQQPQRDTSLSLEQEEGGEVWRRLGSVRLLRNSFPGIASQRLPHGWVWQGLSTCSSLALCWKRVAAPSLTHPGAARPNQPRSWPSLGSSSGCWYRAALRAKLPTVSKPRQQRRCWHRSPAGSPCELELYSQCRSAE